MEVAFDTSFFFFFVSGHFDMLSSLASAGAGWHDCAQEQGSAHRKPAVPY